MYTYTIKSIIINNVQVGYAPTYIVNCFKNEGIAAISRMTCIPCSKRTGYVKVFADIAYWHDTERAYQFIRHLMDNGTVRFRHTRCHFVQQQRWNVHINRTTFVTHDEKWKSMTTTFPTVQIYSDEPYYPVSQEGIIDVETAERNDAWKRELQQFADSELNGEYTVVGIEDWISTLNPNDLSIPRLERDDESIICKNNLVLVKNTTTTAHENVHLKTYVNIDFINDEADEENSGEEGEETIDYTRLPEPVPMLMRQNTYVDEFEYCV